MIVVSDTGPLIALAKADQLPLLKQLFGKINIPPAVHRELLAKSEPEAGRLDRALLDFVIVTSLPSFPQEVEAAIARLGPGEGQAIALAYAQEALLLIDDRQGRNVARHLGLRVSGVVGVLILAKEAGLVAAVRPLLEEIRQQGYWLSDELVAVAARLTQETLG